ncbi:hypothetical protein Dimus_008455 [Dionaea muscipula]
MLFSNGVLPNTRKRGREPTAAAAAPTTATTTTTTPAANINSFDLCLHKDTNHHQQQQQPQIIDLTQLQNHHQPHSNVVSTGLKLSFGDQQQQQQLHHHHHQQQQLHHHQQQQLHHHEQQQQQHNLASISSSSFLLSLLSQDFVNQIKQQTDELNLFIRAQGEQLRRTLAEKRQRHYLELLGVAKETVARRLREMLAEVEKANHRNAELEARVARLSAEAQVWQTKARSQEAQAASLQAQLQQAKMIAGTAASQHHQQDGDGGGADLGGGQAEDAESAYVDPQTVGTRIGGPACNSCRKRVATVVLLPCWHLCVCSACNALVEACPLCLSLRQGGVEVFFT